MKKFIFLQLMICCIFLLSANDLVPPGTYSNLVVNGKLELYAGTFPQPWRVIGSYAPGYSIEGGYNNGGRFIFTKENTFTTVRQSWTFTIIPGEKYRYRAKVRASKFKSATALFIVLNNGFKKFVSGKIPQGTYDWKEFSFEFTAFESRGGYYSTAIRVNNQSSGVLEISDIVIEPATRSAFEKSTAYLKLLPDKKLIPVSPRLKFIPDNDAKLICRWFGDKNVKELNYTVGGKQRKAAIRDGLTTLDLSGLKPAGYTIKVAEDKNSPDIAVRIVSGADNSGFRSLNNLHQVLAEKTVKNGDRAVFGNPRNGWIYFRMPQDMVIEVSGTKLKNGQFIRLELGNHGFKVLRGSGKVTVSAVTEVSMYAFATGPFFTNIPQKNWNFEKKYMFPYVMNYFGGGSLDNVKKLRKSARKHYRSCHLTVISDADVSSTKPIQTRGTDPDFKDADGIYIDELAMGSTERTQVRFMKNLERLEIAPGRDVYTYICGQSNYSRIASLVFSLCSNLTPHSYLLAELYLRNTHTDEKLAQELIDERLTGYISAHNAALPGNTATLGVSLCQSNMPLNFTLDHEPEADHRVFLDMQMNAIANHSAFKNLGCLNFWGGNYADTDRQRWIAALCRHYVFEGKKTMLSEEFGLKLAPGHLKNASFREKLKYWKANGSVAYGQEPGGAQFLKYFKNNKNLSHMAVFTGDQTPAVLAQTLNNLEKGKKYKVRFVTSGKGLLALKVDGKKLDVRVSRLNKKRYPKTEYADNTALCEAVFTANAESGSVEFSIADASQNTTTNLHFVSVFRCIYHHSHRK